MGKGKKRKLQQASSTTHKRPKHSTEAQSTISSPRSKLPPTIPFDSGDRIILVGEGDFSFARSIVDAYNCCDVTATCFDSQSQLFEKYDPQAEEHVKYLESEGQTVIYNVDATKLDNNKGLKKHATAGALFDVAIFNFPHVGGKSKDVNRQVRYNQELLVSFFTSCQPLLTRHGTIVVTLFEGEPYTLWNVRDLGRHSGLEVQRSFRFQAEAYPGYSHSRTLGNIEGGGGWKGEDREARSYVFQKKKTKEAAPHNKSQRGGGKRKRGDESSDDEG